MRTFALSAVAAWALLFVLSSAQEEEDVDFAAAKPFKEGSLVVKHSLKGPYGAIEDLSPWSIADSAELTTESIKLTPDERSKVGWLFNDVPLYIHDFGVDVTFRVTGKRYVGGDGFVFWIIKTPKKAGRTFGHDDAFEGLGFFFDSYDNDGGRDNPALTAMFNAEGESLPYDHNTDGKRHMLPSARCRFNYRNTKEPALARFIYNKNDLMVYVGQAGKPLQQCFTTKGIVLPRGYYLGFSAATGDVADIHEVLSVNFYSLEATVDERQRQREEAHRALDETLHGEIPGERNAATLGDSGRPAPASISGESVMKKLAHDVEEFQEERRRDMVIDRSAANQDEEKETAGTARRPLETEKADRAYDEKKADRASSAANAESAQINLDKSALRAISDEVRDAVSPLRRETDRIGDSLYKMASKVDELAVKRDGMEMALHKLSDSIDSVKELSARNGGGDAQNGKELKRVLALVDELRNEVGAVMRDSSRTQTEMRSALSALQGKVDGVLEKLASEPSEAVQAGVGYVGLFLILAVQTGIILFGGNLPQFFGKKKRDHLL